MSSDFSALLDGLCANSNEVRNAAELKKQEWEKVPTQFIPALLEQARSHTNDQAKMLCAILLRQQLKSDNVDTWTQLSLEQQNHVKEEVIRLTLDFAGTMLAKKFAHVMAELSATISLVQQQQWNDVFSTMLKLLRSQDSSHRVTGLFLLAQVSERTGVSNQLQPIWRELEPLLGDNEVKVRSAALQAALSIMLTVSDSERKTLANGVPTILQTFSTVLQHDEDEGRACLKQFVELSAQHPTIMRAHLDSITYAMLMITKHNNFEVSTRQLGLEVLLQMCEEAGGMVRKNKRLVSDLVAVAMHLLIEVEDDPEWETKEEDMRTFTGDQSDDELAVSGEEAVDRIVRGLGGDITLPLFVELIGTFMNAQEWRKRRAAFISLALLGEVCKKLLQKQLGHLSEKLAAGLEDPHPRVRYAALRCIGQYALDFADCGRKSNFQAQSHKLLVPKLVSALRADGLSNGIERIRSMAASAVANYLHRGACKPEYLQPVSALLESFVMVLRESRFVSTKENAMTAIAAASAITKAEFAQFYDTFMSIAKEVFEHAAQAAQTDKSYRMLRNKGIEAIGLICASVGRERCYQDAKQAMDILARTTTESSNFEADDPESYRYMNVASLRIGKVLGDEFVRYLPVVLPPLVHTATKQVETLMIDPEDASAMDDVSEMQHLSVKVQGMGTRILAIDSAAVQDKTTAYSMLFHYVDSLSHDALMPFLDTIAEAIFAGIRDQQIASVRLSAICAAPRILRVALKDTANVQHGQRMLELMLPQIRTAILEETDRENAATACEALAEVIKKCHKSRKAAQAAGAGSAVPFASIPQDSWRDVIQLIRQAMEKSVATRHETAQKSASEDFDEETERQLLEMLEVEDELMVVLCDATGYLIKSFANDILPVLHDELLPLLSTWLEKWEPHESSLLACALCTIVDIIEFCIPEALVQQFLPYCQRALTHCRETVRQAAAYGIGVIAQKLPGQLANDKLPTIVDALRRCTSTEFMDDEDGAVVDNCVAALLKIALFIHSQAGYHGNVGTNPEASAIINFVVESLPLTGDAIEGRVVHEWFIEAIKRRDPVLVNPDANCVKHITNRVLAVVCAHEEAMEQESDDEDEDNDSDDSSVASNVNDEGPIAATSSNDVESLLSKQSLHMLMDSMMVLKEANTNAFNECFQNLSQDQQQVVRKYFTS